MKPATLIGVAGMLVAMVLYSVGVWGAFRAKKVREQDVMFILGGVVFDVIGTGGMFVTAGNKFLWSAPHTWAAFVAFFGMLLVGIAGTWLISAHKDELVAKLSRWALAPWALWAAVFVCGMLQRPTA